MNEHLVDDVLDEYRASRSPYRVARALGVRPDLVIEIVEANRDKLSPRKERWGGEGRPELRAYMVARKRACEAWDNDSETVAAARAAYEAGTHELVQGRDGDWLILYAIPRVKTQPRPDHFKPVVG